MKNHNKVSRGFLQYCNTATLPLCLSSCMGVYEGGFECPPGKGVGCKSISEVNQMVDQHSENELPGLEKPYLESRIWYNPSVDSIECSNWSIEKKPNKLVGFNAKNSI